MKSKKTKLTCIILSALVLTTCFAGCGSKKTTNTTNTNTELTGDELVQAAKKEGKIVSYGMPDTWANLGEIWKGFSTKYGVTHTDTDMSSAEEISKFKAEANKPIADVGDIGIGFASTAMEQGVLLNHKNPYWSEIPDWAKDPNGAWCAEYTGTICLLVNKKLVKNVPHSWADLLKPEYKNQVVLGDPTKGALEKSAVLSAAFAYGGDESNITPGVEYFAKLKKAGNLKAIDNTIANIQKGEIPIVVEWDFLALSYKDKFSNMDLEAVIPSDGAATVAYVAVINKYAPHPNAAKLFNDYLFSDEAQINYAKGFAKPIRNVTLPEDVQKKMIPEAEYKASRPIKDYAAWQKTQDNFVELWQEKVLGQ